MGSAAAFRAAAACSRPGRAGHNLGGLSHAQVAEALVGDHRNSCRRAAGAMPGADDRRR